MTYSKKIPDYICNFFHPMKKMKNPVISGKRSVLQKKIIIYNDSYVIVNVCIWKIN